MQEVVISTPLETELVESLRVRHPDCGVAKLVAQQDLDQVLPELDVLVLAVPHTAETEGLLSARHIGLLAPTCLFLNIARGSVVDEPALGGRPPGGSD
jgi:phosphoglycerate dehydrogenase-like enzyme